MSDAPSQSQDKFIVRLPDGMRLRIKRAAEANGRSMNAEVVSALASWFPDPTPEEYLGWLYREVSLCRASLNHVALTESERAEYQARLERAREKMLAVIDETADPATFDADIEVLSDYRGRRLK